MDVADQESIQNLHGSKQDKKRLIRAPNRCLNHTEITVAYLQLLNQKKKGKTVTRTLVRSPSQKPTKQVVGFFHRLQLLIKLIASTFLRSTDRSPTRKKLLEKSRAANEGASKSGPQVFPVSENIDRIFVLEKGTLLTDRTSQLQLYDHYQGFRVAEVLEKYSKTSKQHLDLKLLVHLRYM